ncbi:MAG: C4-dicarboxylate ABC transporter permease [Clostridiaceae bacterium BRH_c20a]|nr:MAG: C4-dicarboxylate ABC transporter permease [Clostridiaceae bacterium BRH_c20a]
MALPLVFSLLILLFLSVPVAFSLGLSAIIAMKMSGMTSMLAVVQSMFANMDSFPLMAVPFFMLAGDLMQWSGISEKLINLAKTMVGHIRGGLGAVSVVTSMFFATLSGSSSATTASIGSILIPAMEKEGYDKRFAAAICASSGELGVIIPPSISMVIYGIAAGVSIADLFLAGFIPGILIGFTLIITVHIISRIEGYGGSDTFTWKEKIRITWEALPALVMPIIILGGIYGGIFTPTEAAVVAVAYAFLVGLINGQIKFNKVIDTFGKSGVSMSIILIIVGNAAGFAWVVTREQIPSQVAELMIGLSASPIVFLLLTNLFLLVVGMFMETLASILIIAPVLAPIAIQYGINPVHFGLIMVVNLAIGMLTPPVGVNLFVACAIAKIRLDEIISPLLKFLFILIVDVLIISYIPQLSLWLPSLFGKGVY